MKLDNIGFYTLSDYRAKQTNINSPLWRCELILTGLCNFKCPYCRGSRTDEDIPFDKAKYIVDMWAKQGLKNIRFSGGEPTMYKHLDELVEYTQNKGIERIALSTNGSDTLDRYRKLIRIGVNDFSISLDACCSAYGDKMAGVNGAWDKVVTNIREISKITYVTVGCVFTEDTVSELEKTIEFSSSLGVSDIRIISSAQKDIIPEINVRKEILDKHPILKYRINNFNAKRGVRGIKSCDSKRCYLVMDDMAVEGDYHYPCIIHLRETKNPIGSIYDNVRKSREEWSRQHDISKDPVCCANCLDVCIDYNNKCEEYKKELKGER